MIADWIQKFIAENTMDGYMGEPAVGVGKVLELVAKVEAEALEKAAKVCESRPALFRKAEFEEVRQDANLSCARDIRALKDRP